VSSSAPAPRRGQPELSVAHPQTHRKPERHRLDRELGELLQELRVVQGGVLILIGFLLVIPFTQRFVAVNGFEKAVYFATLLAAGGSAILIVAPVSYHRVVFRQHDKQALLSHSNTLVMIGLGLFALTIFGVITLVSDFVFSVTLTVIADSVFALAVALLWYAMPLRSRHEAIERLRLAAEQDD
jgi:Family of unknown function (DUF6328)